MYDFGGLSSLLKSETSDNQTVDSELSILNSLSSMLNLLPGCIRDQRSGHVSNFAYCSLIPMQLQYYVQGNIGASDWESLYNYTKRIGELTLGEEPSESRLAPHVLARIAQLQDPTKPLFPFLHCLRILNTSPYLDFLHLFLSSALTTLQLTAISDDNPSYCSVLSFLESAIDQAPRISTFIGSGQIQDDILGISLRYQNLRSLQLVDVGISITGQLLQDIGSLQHLEEFEIVHSGTSPYAIPNTIPPTTSTSKKTPKRNSKTTMTKNFSPIALEQCHSPEPVEPVIDPPILSTQVIDSQLFPVLQRLVVSGDISLIETLVTKVSSPYLWILEIYFRKPPRISTSEVESLIRHLQQKSGNSLTSVDLSTDTTTFSLPHEIFECLLLCPDMKNLKISGMGIDLMNSALNRLKEVADSKLEILHLPIHPTAPDISFTQLRSIAEACPHLKSFSCRFKHLADIPISSPLSHQLKELSAVNARAHPKHQALLDVARCLDSIFPNLESVNTYEESENNAEQWRFISDSVKLCQAIRKDDKERRLRLLDPLLGSDGPSTLYFLSSS